MAAGLRWWPARGAEGGERTPGERRHTGALSIVGEAHSMIGSDHSDDNWLTLMSPRENKTLLFVLILEATVPYRIVL